MKIFRKTITFAEVEKEFLDVGENLNGLSVIRMYLVKDVHDDGIDLCVEIFGDGDPETESPVLDLHIDLDSITVMDELNIQGFNREKITALFDAKLIDELIQRKIPIEWNRGDKTRTVIDISNPGTGFLQAMER